MDSSLGLCENNLGKKRDLDLHISFVIDGQPLRADISDGRYYTGPSDSFMEEISVIYLDHAATAPLCREAFEAMQPYLTERFGNPSALYDAGTEGRRALNAARRQIAQALGADPAEIFLTSGGTESDNLAIIGTLLARPGKKHIITSMLEHPAVFETVRRLERFGYRVTYLRPDENGRIRVREAGEAVCADTALISVMYANNETGVLQPVRELGELAASAGIPFHTDAVQAFGHVPVSVRGDNIGLLSASAHKFGGPKGIGFLYARQDCRPEPLFMGGGQEAGLRSGTEATALAAGMGAAAAAACRDMEQNRERLETLAKLFVQELEQKNSRVRILLKGSGNRLPGFVVLLLAGQESSRLVMALNRAGICVSGGSACAAGSGEPSRVLTAMGLLPEEIRGSLRITIGPENTREEVLEAAGAVAAL